MAEDQMAILFNKAKSTISKHIKHIFEEKELDENSVVRKFRTTASDGKNFLPLRELSPTTFNSTLTFHFLSHPLPLPEMAARRHES